MADGIVTSYVTTATQMLGEANKAGFEAIVNGINTTALAIAVLSFALLIINQFYQVYAISLSEMLSHLVKLLLISYFALKWSNFDAIASAVQNGMDSIAQALLSIISSSVGSGTSLSGAIDSILSDLSTASNQALQSATWFGGALLTMVVVVFLTILGAVAALIIIYSKIMISLYIMLAPAFICCLIFPYTADFFSRWLQGAIAYALYPVVTSGIIAMIAGVTLSYVNSLNKSTLSSITEFIPFLTVVLIAIVIIVFIPTIVSSISGMVQHVNTKEIIQKMQNAINSQRQKV
ncbi:type IV secretion system protein [Brucella intermedia]|uniref:type IV secretion system protein n=1 Tax=Brucella intermedia TaxID=94625 RepID=UPI00235E5E3D|nr:type IV secretion system protein [Brucella intermedia]